MLALLGSGAMVHHVAQFRKPVDCDLLGTYEDIQEHINYISKTERIRSNIPTDGGNKIVVKTFESIYEYEVAWYGSCAEALLKIIEEDKDTFKSDWIDGLCLVPNLDILYMLKSSHKFRKNSVFFKKTLDDIIFMKSLGAKIPEQYMEWFKWRERETYQNQLPKLNVSKQDFFSGDNVPYIYDHDSLHEAIKFKDVPAYTLFSGGEVWSDMKKFDTLAEEDKLLAVLEECLVLASERSQTSFNPPPDKRWSFEMALSKVCSSITSGKFRAYAHDNYYKVVAMYDEFGHTYMDKVNEGIRNGTVKPFKQEMKEVA